ncbi:MAG: Gfo/Idh/MocA family oxidoreductase [Pseudomonadales bacterium]|mgnify:CR=1 FL=1|nr:Gfo/Idh/MocA family oxidoreductase [Pseudomonadales bacterium]MDP7597879.1 Gfo/Idh/MocA family oxidoreductase [Pseudomonadales bacterium]HJN51115.1 Gfo/Idh/MocA family oxidoreductase [Pseudomonadales bacterium]
MSKSDDGISRRQLMKGAAATATAIFAQSVSRGVAGATGKTAANDTVNVAAIGAGFMGGADIRSADRAGAKIVALCDVDQERAAPVYRDFPNATRYTDFRRLLDSETNIDAVIIATPDHSHATIAMAAMQRGKHVYCEKPLAHTMYETRMLTEAAREHGVATQLGNQGHSFKAIREFRDCIRSGAIGEVREVHAVQAAFGYSRIGDLARIDDDHPVPKTLDWDLWLGPAPYRKYNPRYVPSNWRGWRQFGSGNMGDFVCHIVDPVFWALDLGAPISVVAEAEGYDPQKHSETFPASSKVRFEFPSRGRRPAVTLYWYDGDRYAPPRPEELMEGEESIPDPGWVAGKPVGALVIGEKGKIVYGSHGARGWRIIPESGMKRYLGGRPVDYEQSGPGLPDNVAHLADWLQACKGGDPAGSNFDYGGPLTEIAALGDIALRMLGTELEWDAAHMMFPNQPRANQYLHSRYRDGWTL